jgi:hypothetical protein
LGQVFCKTVAFSINIHVGTQGLNLGVSMKGKNHGKYKEQGAWQCSVKSSHKKVDAYLKWMTKYRVGVL